MATADQLKLLKLRGNAKFKAAKNRDAIDLYTEALASAFPTTPLEDKRQVLSNRAQAYFKWGELYNALRDCDLALSPAYTTPHSPVSVTRKCLWRKAKILHVLLRWDDAEAAFDAFARASAEMGEAMDGDAFALQAALTRCCALPRGGAEWVRAQLLRAVNARGLLVQEDNIPKFPQSGLQPPLYVLPSTNYGPVSFSTALGLPDASLPDPLLTPLRIPLVFRTPFFTNPINMQPFSLHCMATEGADGSLGALFDSEFAETVQRTLQPRPRSPAMRDVQRLLSPGGGQIFLHDGQGTPARRPDRDQPARLLAPLVLAARSQARRSHWRTSVQCRALAQTSR
ncbi:hypothetical protein FA95DRAFT_1609869 [Auriscalpium vulgare]|uniref:Uncharacterized protein n=1 Tax=Auriscalpium vulgare TaxID=40419 RepID=A0ACB8RG20_9AGAM|nr:hypothetical protein FA95DRAFT_1609869 [Auriscalpium vulgare]